MPKKTLPLPSQETLRALLHYEPATGKLYWRERTCEMFPDERARKIWNTRYADKEAFASSHTGGYRWGSLLNKKYLAHRIIWKWMTGEEPDEIDHEKGNRSDNRWGKLRDVSSAGNKQNMCVRSDSASGATGVNQFRGGRWRARIKGTHLGLFKTQAEAIAARKAAEREHGFHPNHGRVA